MLTRSILCNLTAMALLLLGSAGPCFAHQASPCEQALMLSYDRLLTHLMEINPLTVEQLKALKASKTAANPLGSGKGLTNEKRIFFEAFEKLVQKMEAAEWRQTQLQLQRRIDSLSNDQKSKEEAQSTTEYIVAPQWLGHSHVPKNMAVMSWTDNTLNLVELNPKKTKKPRVAFVSFNENGYFTRTTTVNSLIPSQKKQLSQLQRATDVALPHSEVKLEVFEVGNERLALRIFDSHPPPARLRPDVGRRHRGDEADPFLDVHFRQAALYRFEKGRAVLEQTFDLGDSSFATKIECRAFGEELDCIVNEKGKLMFFRRGPGGNILQEQTLDPLPSVHKMEIFALDRHPEGDPLLAVSDYFKVWVYRPLKSTEPIREYELSCLHLSWFFFDGGIFLTSLGYPDESSLLEPFENVPAVKLPLKSKETNWVTSAVGITKDGRVLLAVKNGPLAEVLSLFKRQKP